MSTAEAPTIDLPQRLWLSLDKARVSTKAMAGHLGVSEGTVRNYMKGPQRGGTVPTRAVLIAWAQRTGVPFEWLSDVGERSTGWLLASPVAA